MDTSTIVNQSTVNLKSPGAVRSDIYYTKLNSQVAQVQLRQNFGRFKQGLNNLTFNSSAQVTIPNDLFVGDCVLSLELPETVANMTLMRGWGYSAIRSVSYLFGGSNVSNQSISTHSIFQASMMECESHEKMSEILRLSGEEIISPGVKPKAMIRLPLPWSSNVGGNATKKPFDTSLLSQPITITIAFNDASAIYGGSAVKPTGFLKAELLTRQFELTDRSMGLRKTLDSNPDLSLSYPFIHKQTANPISFTVANPDDENSLVLQSFTNGDLVAITLGVVSVTDETPVSNNSPSTFNYVDLEDVQLLFNGQKIFDMPASIYKLNSSYSLPGASFIHNSVLSNGTTNPFSSNPVDTYICVFDFGRLRSLTFQNDFENTPSIGNQVLEIRFKVPNADNYRLHATYYYNSVNEVNQGQSNIYLN